MIRSRFGSSTSRREDVMVMPVHVLCCPVPVPCPPGPGRWPWWRLGRRTPAADAPAPAATPADTLRWRRQWHARCKAASSAEPPVLAPPRAESPVLASPPAEPSDKAPPPAKATLPVKAPPAGFPPRAWPEVVHLGPDARWLNEPDDHVPSF